MTSIFRGWWIALALAIGQPVTWGVVYYAFPVFLDPMQQELGWTRTQLTAAFSISLLVSGVAGLPIGRWLDRYGARWILTFGSVAVVALLLLWSQVESLAAFYLIWFALGICMAATFYEPAFATIATWFRVYRSRALTLVTFGGGFASVVFIPLANYLVERQGWRDALVTLAVIVAVITIPLYAVVIRRRPEDDGLCPDGKCRDERLEAARATAKPSYRQALETRSFQWLIVAYAIGMFVNAATLVHAIPIMIERGQSSSEAAFAAGAIGLMALPGRVILTPLGDWLPRWSIPAAIFLLQSVALSVLAVTTSVAGIWVFVVLFGLGFGAITPARAALVAELFDIRIFAGINGVMAMIVAFSRAFGPVAGSLVRDASQSYVRLIWILVAMNLCAALCVARTRKFQPSGEDLNG